MIVRAVRQPVLRRGPLEQFLGLAMLLDPFLNFLKHIHGDVQALGLSSYLLGNSERTMLVTACAATVRVAAGNADVCERSLQRRPEGSQLVDLGVSPGL